MTWVGLAITYIAAHVVMSFMIDHRKLPFSPWHLFWMLPVASTIIILLMAFFADMLARPTGIYWE